MDNKKFQERHLELWTKFEKDFNKETPGIMDVSSKEDYTQELKKILLRCHPDRCEKEGITKEDFQAEAFRIFQQKLQVERI